MTYVTNEYDNLYKIKRDGFAKSSKSLSAIQLRVSKEVKDGEFFTEEELINILTQKLIQEAIHQHVVNITKHHSHNDNKTEFQCEINVVPAGTRFYNVSNDTFVVQGEEFNETDLIEAVRIAYPERFI